MLRFWDEWKGEAVRSSCVDPLPVTAVAAIGLGEFARLKSLVFLIGSAGLAEGLRFFVVLFVPSGNASPSSYIHSGDSIDSILGNEQLCINTM